MNDLHRYFEALQKELNPNLMTTDWLNQRLMGVELALDHSDGVVIQTCIDESRTILQARNFPIHILREIVDAADASAACKAAYWSVWEDGAELHGLVAKELASLALYSFTHLAFRYQAKTSVLKAYFLQIVMEEVHANYRPGTTALEEIKRQRFVTAHMVCAENDEQAYHNALDLVSRSSDSHCDAGYDMTSYSALGIFELERVGPLSDLKDLIQSEFGIDLGCSITEGQRLQVKNRDELAVFQSSSLSIDQPFTRPQST